AVTALSHRETDVFLLMGKGLPPRKIAAELNISAKTVESHRRNIRKKRHISSASEMIQFAVDWTRRNCS
ncbi:MAG: helix-turn-helix transcriptional regulator, partial [Desulfobacteraceae bacterium]